MSSNWRTRSLTQCLVVLTVVAAMGSTTAWAQQPADLEVLTPEQVLQKAVAQNPELRAAILDWRQARLQVTYEDYLFTPNAFAEADYTNGRRPSKNPTGVSLLASDSLRLSTGLDNTFRTGTQVSASVDFERATQDSVVLGNLGQTYGMGLVIELAQPWLRGFGTDITEANLHISQLQADSALAQRDQTASTLARDVLSGYWQLWYAQQELDIALSSRDLAQRKLDEGRARLKVGRVSEADLIPLQTEVARLNESVSTAQAGVQQARVDLAKLLSVPPTQAGWTTVQQAPTAEATPAIEAALETAEKRSYQLHQLKLSVGVSDIQAKVAENAALPRLDSTASVQVSGLGADLPDAFDQIGGFDAVTGMVGLRLELPIFDKGLDAEAERADLAVDSAKARYQSALDQLRAQVANSVHNLQTAKNNLELAKKTADLAAKQVEVQSTLFDNGRATMIDVVTALQDQSEAQLRVAQARLNSLQLALSLQDLTGTLLERLSVKL